MTYLDQHSGRLRDEIRARFTPDEIVNRSRELISTVLRLDKHDHAAKIDSFDDQSRPTPEEMVDVAKNTQMEVFQELARPALKTLFSALDGFEDGTRVALYEALETLVMSSAGVGMMLDSPLDKWFEELKAADLSENKESSKRRKAMGPFIERALKTNPGIGPHLGQMMLVKKVYNALCSDEDFKQEFHSENERQIKRDLRAILTPSEDVEGEEE